MDGSTNPSNCSYVLDRDGDLWQRVDSRMWRCLTTQSCLVAGADLLNVCGPLTKLLPADDNTTEATDQARPVVDSVARIDLDAVARALDALRHDDDVMGTSNAGLVESLLSEVRRLRDQVAEHEQLRSADVNVIGKLGAAVSEGEKVHRAVRAALLQGGQLAEIRCRHALTALGEAGQ